MNNTYNEVMQEIRSWSVKTFGEADALPKINHLALEVIELHDALRNGTLGEISKEFADCFILLVDGAAAHGITFNQLMIAVAEKHEENKLRTWSLPNEFGVCHHIKEAA